MTRKVRKHMSYFGNKIDKSENSKLKKLFYSQAGEQVPINTQVMGKKRSYLKDLICSCLP